MPAQLHNKHYGDVVNISDLNKETRTQIENEVSSANVKVRVALLIRFEIDCTVGVAVYCIGKKWNKQYQHIIHEDSNCNSIREWAEKHTGVAQ